MYNLEERLETQQCASPVNKVAYYQWNDLYQSFKPENKDTTQQVQNGKNSFFQEQTHL